MGEDNIGETHISRENYLSTAQIDQLRTDIKMLAGLSEDGIAAKPLKFFKGTRNSMDWQKVLPQDTADAADTDSEQDQSREAQKDRVVQGTQHVLTELSHQLGTIGIEALNKYQENPGGNAEYLDVARTMDHLVAVLKEAGVGGIAFARDFKQEQRILDNRPGDNVYIFTAGPIEIDGRPFDKIEFYIRPKEWEYTKQKLNHTEYQYRQARTALHVASPDLPRGAAGIRIDPPSVYADQNVEFDVVVGTDDENYMDTFDIPRDDSRTGHHFTSGCKLEDMKLEEWQLHEAIAARLQLATNHTALE